MRERKRAFVGAAVTKGIDSSAIFKNSDCSWLGKIPEHWKTLRCKYLFKERDERSTEGKEQHLSMSQKYGLIPDTQLDERRMLSESYAGGKLCYKNDLVLNRLKAHLGVFSLAPQLGVISPDYTVLIPDESKIVPEYAEAVLKSDNCRRELRIRVKGVTEGFWRLYTDDFNTIVVPVPPLAEQASIMSSIQSFESNIDAYIKKFQDEIDILHELRNSLIADVVIGQIDVRHVEIPDFEYVEEIEDASDEEETDDEANSENEEV